MRLPTIICAFVLGLLASCGLADDDTGLADEVGNDAAITLEGASLVWAFDDTPLGETLDYSEGIEQDRLDAGVEVVMRFRTEGTADRISYDLTSSASIDGQPLRFSATSDLDVLSPENAFELVERDDEFEIRLNIGRPPSPVGLNRLRERLTAAGVPLETDFLRIVEDVGGDNRLDYGITVSGMVGSGNSGSGRSYSTSLTLEVREDAPVDLGFELDPAADCSGLLDQYLVLLDQAIADSGTSLNARRFAMADLADAADDKSCGPSEFEELICTHGLDAASSGGEAGLLRFEVVERACGNPAFAVGRGVILVPPSEEFDTLGHQITFEFDQWVSEGRSTANGQFLTIDHPDVAGAEIQFEAEHSLSGFDAIASNYLDGAGVETTVAGRRAQRHVPSDGPEWVRTLIELDTNHYLLITADTGFGDDLSLEDMAAMLDQIEATMIITSFS